MTGRTIAGMPLPSSYSLCLTISSPTCLLCPVLYILICAYDSFVDFLYEVAGLNRALNVVWQLPSRHPA